MALADRLTNRSFLLSYRVGGAWSPSGPTFSGEGIPLQCKIRNFRETDGLGKIELSALCDTMEESAPGRATAGCTFESFVPKLGRIWRPLKGYFVEITPEESPDVVAPAVRYGWVQSVEYDVSDESAQVETVTITYIDWTPPA